MITNPPYGERISTPNLLETYKMIGERLKHAFGGNEAWVLSYRKECFDAIGLKPSIKYPLYNGALECELRKYVCFDGKTKSFLKEGNEMKTDRERKEMAQTHRFKKSREFKERLQHIEEMEESDILSFTFRKPSRPLFFDGEGKGGHKFHGRDERVGKQRKFRDNEDGDSKPRKFNKDRGGKRDFGGKKNDRGFKRNKKD